MGVLTERLSQDLRDAMRAGDSVRRDEIRGVVAALRAEQQARLTRALAKRGLILQGENQHLTPEQEAEVERIRAGSGLTDEEELAVLLQRVKQHRQSIEGFERGARADLVAMEQAQLAVLDAYLPQQAAPEDIDREVLAAIADSGASGPRDMARVMQVLSPKLRGRADMKAVSARVQALLASG
ncbi:MAG: GatB/YqeY domain-containing protein [Chloroflexi bacterium]|nr:GatB/YqeY domain-containing protein [Chloroflexota bacterium]